MFGAVSSGRRLGGGIPGVETSAYDPASLRTQVLERYRPRRDDSPDAAGVGVNHGLSRAAAEGVGEFRHISDHIVYAIAFK